MSLLRLHDIHKRYGPVTALSGLDMTVEAGHVYGFLGRNGAGKSTALQVIMGITFCDRGTISLFDTEIKGEDPAQRRRVGYVAQEQHFYDWMTADRIGRFVKGFYPSWDDDEYLRLLALLEVPRDRKILGYSGGMRAKLALCLALAHRPELLLLDEPTAGMDAVSRREFIDIVREQAITSGRTTLFSSHHIDEVEQAASMIGIIDRGTMKYEGSLEELRRRSKRLITEASAITLPTGYQVLDQRRADSHSEFLVFMPTHEGAGQELALLGRQEQPSLEDIFISMVSRRVPI